MKLIIGLGNPGKQYEKTRHNAGFMALDYLQSYYQFEAFKTLDKGKSVMTKGNIAGEPVILLKPQTFMNLSGVSAQAVSSYFKIPREDIMVAYDDVEIESGSIRIRQGGSAGGHNGIKSLIAQLGGDDFIRLRIGIKADTPFRGALEDYVLGKFDSVQQASVNNIIHDLPAVIETLLKEDLATAMNRYN